jgi:nitric oxide reductase subunit B
VLGNYYMDVQDQIAPFYWVRLGSGLVVVAGALLFLYAIYGPVHERKPQRSLAVQPAE